MALFKREPDEPAAAASPRTYIAASSHIEGSISGETEVLVDGAVDGCVELEGRFVVGTRGRIEGDVTARSVHVSGHVHGSVRATEKIEVANSGSIQGDLTAPLISVAEGGLCNGRIEMTGALAISPESASLAEDQRPLAPQERPSATLP